MDFSYFIAQRLRYNDKESFSSTVAKIAITSVAGGVAVMIVAYCILVGFRQSIQQKVFSFGAHINITRYNTNSIYEQTALSAHAPIVSKVAQLPGVAHIQPYAFKPGLLKTDDEVQGVVMKGVDKNFNLRQFGHNMVAGRFIKHNDTAAVEEIVISQKLANMLHLKVDSEVVMYFLQQPPRFRKLKIAGIYETGLEEFDENMIIGDLRLVQDLNNWNDTLVGGYEVFVKDFSGLDDVFWQISDLLDFELGATKITDSHAQIFEWLGMIGRNVEVLMALITLVAGFNMVSTLLIMILERTHMIGVLKALGATHKQVRKVFMYSGIRLILYGLMFGNLAGLGLAYLQYQFHWVPLNPENYYMHFVPIAWDWTAFLLINIITFVLTVFALLIPTVIIARIQPIKAIKFD